MGKRLEDVASLDITGSQLASLNRTFRCEPGLNGFRDRAASAARWLYYAGEDERWHLGGSSSKNAARLSTALRSSTCDASTLPVGAPWEERVLLFGRLFGFGSSSVKVRCESWEDCRAAWEAAGACSACPSLQIVDSEIAEVNGMYDLTAPAGEVPKYCQRGREAWLYYASDGRWHFGVGRVADRGAPGHHLRSCECRVGTLPVDVCGWEIYDRWAREARPSFTASATRLKRLATDEWLWDKEIWSSSAALEISGSGCHDVDGCYELHPARRHVDGSPVFKHRTSERLLFFASDGRWYAGGNTDDMNLWASRGQLRSRVCAAGTLPGDVEAWEVELSLYGYVRSRTCKVLSIPGCELQLCKDAIRAAPPAVHIAGAAVDNWNGKYLLQIHSSCPTRRPTFRKAEGDSWLYQCDDGRWYVGHQKHKERRCAGRGLRSSACDVRDLALASWDEHRWSYAVSVFEPAVRVKVLTTQE